MAQASHALEGRWRTMDVLGQTVSFEQLALPSQLRRALALAGFKQPSPVQEAAIPLARLGSDLVVQAKSGTGKSLVFAVACLERVVSSLGSPQALVVCPTRELAQQCSSEIARLSANLPCLPVTTGVFIGGVPVAVNQKTLRRNCQVVVGTPGRLAWLIQSKILPTKDMKVMVLDEADQLFSESMRDEVEYLLKCMPTEKQFLAVSATYNDEILEKIEAQMHVPQRVFVSSDHSATLLGVRQCYRVVGEKEGTDDSVDSTFDLKANALINVFNTVGFHQALVFYNDQARAAELAEKLTRNGFPAEFISGMKVQEERGKTISAMRKFKLRVVVSTDLMARGIDMERVNLVCNLDMPISCATYLHRLGRTGRFGTFGLAISIVTTTELDQLKGYAEQSGGTVEPLPLEIPQEWYKYDLQAKGDKVAYKKLLQASVLSEPLRHFKRAKSMMDLTGQATAGLHFWRGFMAERSEIWDSWDPYDVREPQHNMANAEQTITTAMLPQAPNSPMCIPRGEDTTAEDRLAQSESENGFNTSGSSNYEPKRHTSQSKAEKRKPQTAGKMLNVDEPGSITEGTNNLQEAKDGLRMALDTALKKSGYQHMCGREFPQTSDDIRREVSSTMKPSIKPDNQSKGVLSENQMAVKFTIDSNMGLQSSKNNIPIQNESAYQAWLKAYISWGEAYSEWFHEHQEWMVLHKSWLASHQTHSQENTLN